MQKRIAFKRIAPEGLQALGHLEGYVRNRLAISFREP